MKPLDTWRRYVMGALGGVASGGALTALGSGALAGSPWLVLGLPVGALLVAWLLLSPAAAFLLTTLIIPIERLGRLTADDAMYTISLMRIVGTFALGSYLLHAVVTRQRLRFGAAFWIYTLYFGLALLGLFHSSHPLGTFRACSAILGNLLFFMLVINIVRSAQLARWGISLWLVSTTLICIFTILTWHFGQGVSEAGLGDTDSRFATVMVDTSEWEALDSIARAAGPTSHSAVYAINLILTLPFFFYFRHHARTLAARLLITVGLLLVLYNIFLTNTRAAMMLAAGVVLVCGIKGMYRITAGGVMAALLGLMALLPLVPDAVWSRVLDPTNYSTERSATLRIRFEYWSAGLDIIAENPITGIGVGNQVEIPKHIKGDAPEETTVHNEYIMTGMEVGVFGWLVFFGFVGTVWWACQSASRMAARAAPGTTLPPDFFLAIQIAMVATLVYGLQVDVFHFPLKGWWLIAGISWAQYLNLTSISMNPPGGVHVQSTHAPGV
jgi:hypothetical protein